MYRYLSDFELLMQVECDLRSTKRERELAQRLRQLVLSTEKCKDESEFCFTCLD